MNTRLIVDNTSQLQELNSQPWPLRLIAKIISYVFHPVFVPIYIIIFLLFIHPNVFAGIIGWRRTLVLLQALVPYILLPVVTVLLLKALGFITSVYLTTQKDRIIPYIACNLWYFWIMYVWRNLPDSPRELIVMSTAVFLASVIGMMANIYIKISMHAIAMGVMTSFMLFLALEEPAFNVYISLSLFVTGLVCTARFIASDHSKKEVYGGLIAGIMALLIATFVV